MSGQVIVGQAAVQIRAVGTTFQSDLQRTVTPGLAGVAAQTESVAQRGTRAFGRMWGAFNSASQGALGPVAGLVSNVQSAAGQLERGSSIFTKGAVAGVAGLGVGVGLQAFASKEQAAKQQLDVTLNDLGTSYDELKGKIDRAIGVGESRGVLASTTLDALNRITLATRDPSKALTDYAGELDLVAARHISVAGATQQIVSAYAGNTRVFKQYGINVTSQTAALKALTDSQAKHVTAVEKLKEAQQALADKEAILGSRHGKAAASALELERAHLRVETATTAVASAEARHGIASGQAALAKQKLSIAEQEYQAVQAKGSGPAALTVAQQIELRNAHLKVAAAKREVSATARTEAADQKAAAGAAHSVDDALHQLFTRYQGQGAAASDTFLGHLRAIGAKLEDETAAIGSKYGPGITAVSAGILAASTAAEFGAGIFSKFTAGGRAATAANATFMDATRAQVAASAVSTEADLASLQAQALLAETEMADAAETSAVAAETAWVDANAGIRTSIAATAATGVEEYGALGLSARASAATASTSLTGLAGVAESSMGRTVAAVGGVVGIIGTGAVASATAHSGAKGAAASTLTGALTGAAFGLSAGGPLGAGIGAAVGGLVGLGLHFHDAGTKADGLTTSVKNLGSALESALSGDKLNPGQQTVAVINSFLAQHGDIAKTFAKYGVGIGDITGYLQHPGSAPPGSGLSRLFAASAGGLSADGPVFDKSARQGKDALTQILALYGAELQTASAIAQINNPKSTAPQHTAAPTVVVKPSPSDQQHTRNVEAYAHTTNALLRRNNELLAEIAALNASPAAHRPGVVRLPTAVLE